jgi:hypothetical protein
MPRRPQADLSLLPPQPMLHAVEEAKDEICAICHGEFDENLETHQLPECHHIFHSECLIRWFRTGNVTCPTCRGEAQAAQQQPGIGGRFHNRTLFTMVSRYARKKTTPKPIQDLYKKWKCAEEKRKVISKEFRVYDKQHKGILNQWRKLRNKSRTRAWIANSHKRHLLHIPIQPVRV